MKYISCIISFICGRIIIQRAVYTRSRAQLIDDHDVTSKG